MTGFLQHKSARKPLPNWVPEPAQVYLAHTKAGLPIRELARLSGCHASTILRQIRKVETRRDDPLVDAALRILGVQHFDKPERPRLSSRKEKTTMSANSKIAIDVDIIEQNGLRILRRLCEKGAVLAVAENMEKAIVIRDGANGSSTRTAVVDRDVAQAMALKNWISAKVKGRITRYEITTAGRTALTKMLRDAGEPESTINEDQAAFADQHRMWGEKVLPDSETGQPKRMRYNLSESPLTALARRRDKDGAPFLSDDLVHVGERLREDFELAQMGPRVAQNWDRFLTSGALGGFAADSGVGDGPAAARQRVADAMTDLGAGLSDVVLRCCCYLEGLETAEKRLGWSARSGKIVLRIALMRLQQHYDRTIGPGGGLIG